MPGRDGTGPQGKGPMTGRGMGMQQGAKRRRRAGTVPQQEPRKKAMRKSEPQSPGDAIPAGK